MIQDILPKLFHNEYTPENPGREDTVFVFHKGQIMASIDGEGMLHFPQVKLLISKSNGEEVSKVLQYLFRIDDKPYYLYIGELRYGSSLEPSGVSVAESSGFHYHPLRLLRTVRPKDVCFAAMTAWHLFVWYRDNRFCGRCGQPAVHDKKERMLRCPACGNQIYPRISPAVIVGVTDKDRILMTRYAGREHKGNALIAGFCEIGETVEETVRREVMEEVGLKIRNIRYYKSQPWGFAGDLLMGFYCEVDGAKTVRLDENELESARWVSRSEIGSEPVNLSLTADMIMHFKHEVGDKRTDLVDHIRGTWLNHIPGIPERRGTCAVVIPLLEKEGEYHILYEQRASNLVHQPGEVCFPGGRLEAGEEPCEAAIRETAEELLIDADQIEMLAAMDAQMGPSGAPIWPFVALIHDYQNTFSADEVKRVFTVPLSWYRQHKPDRHLTELVTAPREDFPYELIPGGRDYPFRKKKHEVIFYQTPEAVIWGVTAKITDDFISRIETERTADGIT